MTIKATLVDHMGSDLTVVNAARVSFGKGSEWVYCGGDYCKEICNDPDGSDGVCPGLSYNDKKLIKYLAEHEHYSPFGHCFASFHVKAPIFVARQLVKHKFLRWNEISRRYVDDEPEFYVPEVWRGKSEDKKQGSSNEVIEVLRMQGFGEQTVHDAYFKYTMYSFDLYRDMVGRGIAPEQARMVLPQSTMTEWYWSGSLDAFADMCLLRLGEDTQYESRFVAKQISDIMSDLYPVSWRELVFESE